MREYAKPLFWVLITLLARIIPHAPNLTPYTSLILLMGYQFSRRNSLLITLISLFLSDLCLALLFGYPIFGLWSLFTYSGFLTMAFASHYLHHHRTTLHIAGFALSSVFVYWAWTNFGTWLIGGLYPHSAAGLLTCFIAGLPFLQASILSALIFVPLFFGLIIITERTWAFKPH
jgi:uncharacterized membrane protein